MAADPSAPPKTLMGYVEEGDITGLENLLQAQHHEKEAVYCALFSAICHNNYEMTKLLLATGVHPGVTDDWGKTMLHRCTLFGSEAVMKLLLEEIQKATKDEAEFSSIINTEYKYGTTPLFLTVLRRDIPRIRLLLKYGADMNSVPSGLRNSFLFEAVCEETADIEKILLQYKVDLCIRDTKGKGFFSYANKFGKTLLELFTELTQRYPERKADLTQVALYDTIITGDLNTVKTLVELGAKLDHVDQFDRTPLGYMVDRLLELFGASNTVFSLYGMVKYILTNGGSVHITKTENRQHLNKCIFMRDYYSVDTNGEILLHVATCYRNIGTITLLLESGQVEFNAESREHLLQDCCSVLEHPTTADKVKLLELLIGLDAEAAHKILGHLAYERPMLYGHELHIDLGSVCEITKLVLRAEKYFL